MSISELSAKGQEFLACFEQEVNIPLNDARELSSWKSCVEKILNGGVFRPKDPFEKKAVALQEKFTQPTISNERINIFSLRLLRQEMKSVLEKKQEKLASMEAFQRMLAEIPSEQVDSFLEVLHSHYIHHFSKGVEQAFSKALSYVLSRSFIEVSEFEQDEDLQRYKCPIRGDLIESQPVYFASQIDSQDLPIRSYHKSDISRWLRERGTDPITRKRKTILDLKEDVQGKKKIQKFVHSLRYIEENEASSSSEDQKVLELPGQSFFLAACLGYPLALEAYQKVRKESRSYKEAAEHSEKIEIRSIELLAPFLKKVENQDLSFFSWKILKKEPEMIRASDYLGDSFPNAQSSFPAFSYQIQDQTERFETRFSFMQDFLKRHIEGEDSIETLQSLLETQMREYLELFQIFNELDLTFDEKKELAEKLRGDIISGAKSAWPAKERLKFFQEEIRKKCEGHYEMTVKTGSSQGEGSLSKIRKLFE